MDAPTRKVTAAGSDSKLTLEKGGFHQRLHHDCLDLCCHVRYGELFKPLVRNSQPLKAFELRVLTQASQFPKGPRLLSTTSIS